LRSKDEKTKALQGRGCSPGQTVIYSPQNSLIVHLGTITFSRKAMNGATYFLNMLVLGTWGMKRMEYNFVCQDTVINSDRCRDRVWREALGVGHRALENSLADMNPENKKF